MWFCKKKLEKKVEKINQANRFDKKCYMEKTVTSYNRYTSESTSYQTFDQVAYSGMVVRLPDVTLYEIREPVQRDYITPMISTGNYERQFKITWVDKEKLYFPFSETMSEIAARVYRKATDEET